MLTSTFTRSRVTYFIMILIVIGLGLASRRYSEVLPDFISRYAGDTLWARNPEINSPPWKGGVRGGFSSVKVREGAKKTCL